MTSVITTEQLPNGLTLAVEPMPHLPSVSWALLVEAGSAGDLPGRSGTANLLGGMVYRGAGGRDARTLSDALDGLGIQRRGGLDQEYATFSGACLGAQFGEALALYADIVRRPALPTVELDAERALALQAIASLHDNPSRRLFTELTQTYFPGLFGRPVVGLAEDLNRIDIGDLTLDHRSRFLPSGGILAVAGGVTPEQVRQEAERLFGDWQGIPRTAPQAQRRAGSFYAHIQQETAQTQIGVAYEGVPLDDPDYYKHRLGLTILSGGMGARLFTEVREKRGLVYSVGASPRLHRGTGSVLAYAGTQPDRAQETCEVLLDEIRRLGAGVTQAEIERARTGLLSGVIMQGESTGGRAAAMASDLFLIGRARTLDEIRAGVEDVSLDALNAYLAGHGPHEFTALTLGPAPIAFPA